MSAVTCLQVVVKAAEGRSAFVRWMSDTSSLVEGESIYQVGEEGFPTPPIVALLLLPLHMLGPVWGALVWWALKCLAMGVILRTILVASDSSENPLPPWAFLVVVALSAYPLTGDMTHGNMNLITGALVAISLLALRDSRDFLSGFLAGAAAVFKVTPGLFGLYFLYKRRWAALAGMAAAGFAFFVLIPGTALGFQQAFKTTSSWTRQMIVPFVSAAAPGYMQARHDNQSLTGAAYRLLHDTPAIRVKSMDWEDGIRVNIAALPHRTVAGLLRAAFVAILAAAAISMRAPEHDRRNIAHLGEYAIVALCMLLISERTWKHHFVLIGLSHGFLITVLLRHAVRGTAYRIVLSCLVAAAILHNVFIDGFIGRLVSDYAEAYGVHAAGTMLLFSACVYASLSLAAGQGSCLPQSRTGLRRGQAVNGRSADHGIPAASDLRPPELVADADNNVGFCP